MHHDPDVAAVVVGFDRNINYFKIQCAICLRLCAAARAWLLRQGKPVAAGAARIPGTPRCASAKIRDVSLLPPTRTL